MMGRYIGFVLRHRAWVLGAIFAITVAAGYKITEASFGSSLIKIFFGDTPEYRKYQGLIDEFGASDVMVVVYKDEDLFSAAGFGRLEKITERLSQLEFVRRVDTLHNAQRLVSDGDDLVAQSYGDLIETSSAAFVKKEVLEDPIFGGLLVAPDGAHPAVSIEFTSDPNRPAETLVTMIEDMMRAFTDAGIARDQIHIAGLLPESAEATESARLTMLRTFPATSIVLVVIVFLLFRKLWPVTITIAVALISVVWAVAFAVFLDPQVSLLIAAVPGVTMVICFSDIIHLCSAYMLEIRAGTEKDEAIFKAGSEVGVACFWTSITTFVGFFSISFVPAPGIRQLGFVLAFGVAVALLLALTLVPIAFSFLARPAPPPEAENSIAARLVDAIGAQSLAFSTRRPWLTIAGFAVLIGVSAVGTAKIEIETNFLNRLDADNPLRVSTDYIRSRFSGTNILDVYIETEQQEGLLDPKRMATIAKLQKQIAALPEVDRVSSIVDVYARIGRAMDVPELPDSRQGLAQYLLLFEVAGGDNLDRLIDPERKVMRYSVRLHDNGFVATARAGEKIAAILGPQIDAKVFPTGLSYIFGHWVDNIIAGQRRGMIFAILATTILMLLALRSLGPGLIAMVPNLLPVAVLGGYVGLAWDKVDTDTLIVAMIGLGIGVDDTIHFLTRLRIESLRTEDSEVALQRTFHFTGRAIVQTTIILCAGFLPFVTSNYFSTKILGTLLPMVLFVALIADLLLVPALVKVGWLKFRRS